MKAKIIFDQETEGKIEAFKRKAADKFQEGKEWCIRNKDVLIVLAPIALGGLATVAKAIGKNANLRKEEEVKNLYCYDRSLGHYWSLKRELTNNEWIEIDRRKRNGERLADILSDFRVLK